MARFQIFRLIFRILMTGLLCGIFSESSFAAPGRFGVVLKAGQSFGKYVVAPALRNTAWGMVYGTSALGGLVLALPVETLAATYTTFVETNTKDRMHLPPNPLDLGIYSEPECSPFKSKKRAWELAKCGYTVGDLVGSTTGYWLGYTTKTLTGIGYRTLQYVTPRAGEMLVDLSKAGINKAYNSASRAFTSKDGQACVDNEGMTAPVEQHVRNVSPVLRHAGGANESNQGDEE